MPESTQNYFESRLKELQENSRHLKQQVSKLSWIRVITFCIFLVGAVYFANAREEQMVILTLIGFTPLFGVIVRKHNKAKFDLAQHLFLITINENEIKRVKGTFSDLDDGIEYLDTHHNYAPDLDLFGSNSLFQLLVRSKLSGTREHIKNWILNKSSKSEIEERQAAIQELGRDIAWGQNLTAYGYHGDQLDKKYVNVVLSLIQWIDDKLNVVNHTFWEVMRLVMPALSITILTGITYFEWPYQWIYLPLIINMSLLSLVHKPLQKMKKEFGNIVQFLRGYEQVIIEIENKTFQSPLLIRLSQQLNTKQHKASTAIKSLRRVWMFLINRENLLYAPFNILFLLDANWLLMAINWKKKNIDKVEKWFDAVHQIDALNDLSSYAFSNPDYTYPTVSNENHLLEAEGMGHPLIKANQRVSNDFHLSEKGKLGLVTGSNMSGKSTFLRTIGVNLVLAQMGAPVCANKFEFSLIQIFTSMRTQDNLEENVSSFYAELKRLRKLLNLLEEGEPVFYMLDEILKGTNSDDRHKGAMSLIDQLITQNCRGLISTHDIQLATLSKKHSNIQNMSFNSSIIADEIIFDYKLSLEPCKSFNASKLMEKMGIIKK